MKKFLSLLLTALFLLTPLATLAENLSSFATDTQNEISPYEESTNPLIEEKLKTYTVTFEGVFPLPQPQKVRHGGFAKKPLDPIQEDLSFIGWFLEEETLPWDFENQTVTKNLTLYPHWEENLPLLPIGEELFTPIEEPALQEPPVEQNPPTFELSPPVFVEPNPIAQEEYPLPLLNEPEKEKEEVPIFIQDEIIEKEMPPTYEVPFTEDLVKEDSSQNILATIPLPEAEKNEMADEEPPIQQESFTVFYDSNGATGGTSPTDPNNSYNANSPVTILGQGDLIKENHTFIGWAIVATPNETHTIYNENDTFPAITQNTVFYAQWKENEIEKFTVTYNSNGATGGTSPTDPNSPYDANNPVTILGQGDLVKEKHTFVGWATVAIPSETDTIYNENDTFPAIIQNTTFYAQWKENEIEKFTVTYNGNGATGGTNPIDPNSPYNQNTPITLLQKGNLYKVGQRFAGWVLKDDPTQTLYQEGSSYVLKGNSLFLAKWEEDKTIYTLTFDGNSPYAIKVPSSFYGPIHSSLKLPYQGEMFRHGYRFIGWNTLANGTGTFYKPGADYFLLGNSILYAQWQWIDDNYTVYFDSRGGSYVNPIYQITYNTTIYPPQDPVRKGYVFTGWYVDPERKIPWNFLIDRVTYSKTLYAGWKRVSSTGGGSIDGSVPRTGDKGIGIYLALLGFTFILGIGSFFLYQKNKKTEKL